jgi:hypothetical protein
MHQHEMQQSNIYLGIYIIDYYLFWKIRVLQYHVRVDRNHHFSIETIFYQQCCDTLFWLIGSCIKLSLNRTHPRVGA